MTIDRTAQTVIDVVGEQALRTPDAVAVRAAGRSMTYQELHTRALALAAHLRATVRLRDGEDTFVVYEGPRDERFAVAALGVLGSGCCLALVDPEWPHQRRDELKAMVGAVVVTGDDLPQPGDAAVRNRDGVQPPLPRGASAYAASTTGTTGAPKIVVTSHGALVDSVVQTASRLELGPGDRVLQFAPLGVDICLEELLTAWVVGGTAVAMTEEAYLDLQAFTDLLAAEGVTTLNLPATFWSAWLAALRDGHVAGKLPALRVVGVGSDVVPATAIAQWQVFGAGGHVYDMYGSTEQAITSAIAGPLDLGAPLTEGRMGVPAEPMSAHVLRADLTEADPGETGELVMAGPSLASYYAANPRLTAAKFVPSPFGGAGMRMYRSGDRAVRLRDGTIRLLGRLDRRVKVRSFSVDLDEVQAVLAAVDGVRAVRVTARQEEGRETAVVADVEPENETADAAKDLAARILREAARVLPEYARPAELVVGGERVVGGAGDRPAEAETAVLHGTQAAAAALWRETLGVADVRPDDNFLDLGGHSLLVARFVTALRRRCGTVLDRRGFLADPTLRHVLEEVAAQDGSGGDRVADPLVPSGRTSGSATAGQTAMWLQRRENPHSASYNVPLLCDLQGTLDVARLEQAVNRVIATQPALRTAVYASKGTLVQEQRERTLAVGQLRDDPVALADFFDAPFDLTAGDVVRVAVGRADGADVVAFAFHHVAVDEASTALFLRFLEQAWRDEDPAPRPTLVDVAEAEAAWKADGRAARAVEEAAAYLGAPCPVSSPWPDATGAAAAAADWECVVAPFTLSDERMRAVAKLARRSGTTLYAVASALFGITLARFTGQKRVIVGVPVSRRTEDTEHTLGPLLSTLPLVVDLTSNPTVGEVITRAARGIERLQDWSGVSLADIVNATGARRVAERAALVQAMVLPEPEAMPSIRLGDCCLVPQVTPPRGATMDILLLPRVWQERWVWDLVYRRARYSPALVAAFEGMLTAFLDDAGRDPDIRVGEVDAAPPEDGRDRAVHVLDDYGRVLPRGAIGWLHPRVGAVDPEEAASGVTRCTGSADGEEVLVNVGVKGRVTHDGRVEVLRGEELTS